MANNKNCSTNWFLLESDLNIGDEAYKITRFHKVWFELLKIHPRIVSIYKLGIGQARNDSRFSDDILKVYEDFRMELILSGQLLFSEWWFKYGQELFNMYTNRQGIHIFAAIPEGESYEYAMGLCNLGIKDYLNVHRSRDPMEGFLAMTVSLSGDKKQMVKQFEHIINGVLNDIEKDPTPKAKPPKYKITPKIQLDTVTRLLSLLHRAIDLYDVKEQWKIGFDVGVYKSGTEGYSHKTIPYNNKTNLIQETSREFRRAMNLLENAAIGKFPCFDDIQSNPLEYREMYEFRKIVINQERKLVKQRETAAYKLKAKQNREKFELQRIQYETMNKIISDV